MDATGIEHVVERVLRDVPDWVWDGQTLPVPVEHIADSHFGLHVREVEDLRTAPGVPDLPGAQGLSGLLIPSLAEVWVNASETRAWPSRRRFTIGHELGHWCLHRVGSRTVWCRSATVSEAAGNSRPEREEEANVFASGLLMPASLVRREHARVGGNLEALCAAFAVSAKAMTRRLEAKFG
jgi:hypothetical protein